MWLTRCCCHAQDDLLYETLTVHETLYYAAMLRLPRTMTTAQKEERVRNVIHTLGLDKCKDTIVGEDITAAWEFPVLRCEAGTGTEQQGLHCAVVSCDFGTASQQCRILHALDKGKPHDAQAGFSGGASAVGSASVCRWGMSC